MIDAQLEKITAGIARLNKNQLALMEEMRILRKVIACGEDRAYPWERLAAPRRKQVEAVANYLRQHPNRALVTVRRAAFAVFQRVSRGYPNPVALATYCYKAKIENWLD